VIPDLPATLNVLHWHEEMFTIPAAATLLFSSEAVRNQGFVLGHRIVGLQFHLEPQVTNVREMVVNDHGYITGSVLGQTAADILATPIPEATQTTLFKVLDYLTN